MIRTNIFFQAIIHSRKSESCPYWSPDRTSFRLANWMDNQPNSYGGMEENCVGHITLTGTWALVKILINNVWSHKIFYFPISKREQEYLNDVCNMCPRDVQNLCNNDWMVESYKMTKTKHEVWSKHEFHQ